jgi:hypothetical protein
MAQIVLTNAGFKLGAGSPPANDFSASVKSITINYTGEAPDATTMGKGTKVKLAGVLDWNVDVGLVNNPVSAALDDLLFALVGTSTNFLAGPDGLTGDGSHPTYGGAVVVTSWQPLQGAHGEVLGSTLHLEGSDTLTRDDT